MAINLIYFPTLAVAIIFFVLGQKISARTPMRYLLRIWSVVGLVSALPALLLIVFYTHWFDNAAWFYAFRAIPYSELSASGLGFGIGLMEGYFRRAMPEDGSIASRWLSPKMLLPVLALLLLVPYIKPLLAPLPVILQDRWSEGVCLQSTPSTCGPASAGTILRYFGISASESELARECFSYGAGTENWYITRALRKRGLKAHYVIRAAQPAEIPYPCIAGTKLGGSGGPGHFVAILGREKARYIIGDPLVGRLSLTPEELHAQYFLTGFFLVITR